MIEKYRSVGLLILGGIGVSFGRDAEKTQIFDVLDGRYREMRPTLIVSNLSLKGLQECLGERMYDRLMQNGGGCLPFDWGSYRSLAAATPEPGAAQRAETAAELKSPPQRMAEVERMAERERA